MTDPRVSLIILTHNRCAYVQEAIDSVLARTYTDYEIIVIDDGSTDGTGATLLSVTGIAYAMNGMPIKANPLPGIAGWSGPRRVSDSWTTMTGACRSG